MTNEECRTALKRIAGYMCAMKDLEALTYAMDVLEHISSELAKNSKKLENNIGELDCISRKRAEEIKDFCDMKVQLEPENEDIFKAIVRILEQEPILDKIQKTKSEIADSLEFWDYSPNNNPLARDMLETLTNFWGDI